MPAAADHPSGPEVRLAELMLGLSAVADLGMRQPLGSAARTCFVAVRLARATGCDDRTVSDVFFAGLLQHVGCTAYSHEATQFFADELTVKSASLVTDFGRTREVLFGYLPALVRAAPAADKLRTARSAVVHGGRLADGYSRANCEVASIVARRLGLSAGVQTGLLDAFEWWNGEGRPRRLRGDDISPVARIVNIAGVAALFDRLGGPDAARHAVGQRAGRLLDPAVAATFAAVAPALLAELAAVEVSDALLDAEPTPVMTVPDAGLEDVLRTFGDAVDLKAPFLQGHATGVARLAAAAARRLRLTPADIRAAGLAGHVHDLGRAAVPTGVWERAASLGRDAWQQVRLHPYHSEQVLARAETLAPLARLAGMHHEHLDGSGYYRGAPAAQIPMPARVLAAADVFDALTSERPHRRAQPADRAVGELRAMARDRRLDPDAVEAVVAAAGQPTQRDRRGRAGLTDRQVDVLRLVAAGLSNRAIAQHLTISPRTAEHHVQDLYARIGVSSRAAVAMYAMEHGLLARDA